mmetsp:Transcript_11856/g.18212  ORF Transcript_11856/g.18212 Transcript_11856/m.18212 type:complete len:410 (+) Transcript_11856:137-1366(+)
MKLSIVRLDHSIAEIKTTTSPGIDVENLSRTVFDYLSCKSALEEPPSPRWYTFSRRNASDNSRLKETLIKSIMRYFKEPDRWTAFSSLLLKSVAFHRQTDPNMSVDVAKASLPVIDLPRTKFNRPFLPRTAAGNTLMRVADKEEVEECRESVMNVSHQFPYICMIQKQCSDHTTSSVQLPYDMIGCDLVTFEALLNKFSPTVTDFIESFVGCFTTSEWQAINNDARSLPRSNESILKEFYLRWAMKEAYTKALGVGFNIDFDSFETRLIGHDVDTTNVEGVWKPSDGIWGSIIKDMKHDKSNGRVEHQFSLVGQVIRMRVQNSDVVKGPKWEGEYWVFTFIPLVDDGLRESSIQSDNTASSGCICICKGPFNEEVFVTSSNSEQQHAIIENVTLLELIQLHGMNVADII